MKKMLLLAMAISSGMLGNVMADNSAVAGTSVSKANNAATTTSVVKAADRLSNAVVLKPISDTPISVAPYTAATEVGNMSVLYKNPVFFYVGISSTGYSYSYTYPYVMMPAYADLTWTNASTGASVFSWQYQDPDFESDDDLVASTTDLTVAYPWAYFYNPTLTASDGTNTGTYEDEMLIMTGGNEDYTDDSSYSYLGVFGAAMYNLYNVYSWTSWEMLGVGSYADNWWATQYTGSSDTEVAGFGNVYPAPAAPYAVSKVWTYLNGEWEAGAVFDLTVYSIKNGEINEVLATGSYTSSSSHSEASIMSALEEATFDLQTDIDGFVSTGYITVSDSIYVEISSSDSKVTSVYPSSYIPNAGDDWFQVGDDGYIDTTNKENLLNAYIRLNFTYNGTAYNDYLLRIPYFWSFTSLDYGYMNPGAYMMNIDAVFGWLEVYDSNFNSVTSVSVPSAGGSSDEYYISTYYAFDDTFFVDSDLDQDGVIDDASWLSYDVEYPYYDSSTGSNYYGYIAFTAEALPDGSTGRSASVELSATGAESVILTVTQGTSGVTSVVATTAANVTVVGDNFVVTAPESITGVTVYNVAGQAVATANVAGTTTIDASSLGKGVYVLRFSDGSTTKVLK